MCFGGGSSSNQISPTADQISQQQINAKLWNYYQTEYAPTIARYAAQVTSAEDKTQEGNLVSGQINAETMKNVTSSVATSNPVKNAKQLSGLAKTETATQGKGQAAVKEKQVADVQNVVDIGRGQATSASKDLGSLAEQSIQSEITSKEISSEEQGATENMWSSLIGGAVGGATAGYLKSKANSFDVNSYLDSFGYTTDESGVTTNSSGNTVNSSKYLNSIY